MHILYVYLKMHFYMYIYQVALGPCDACIGWLSSVLSQAIDWNSTDLLSIDSSGINFRKINHDTVQVLSI